jgi:hypothetical protein
MATANSEKPLNINITVDAQTLMSARGNPVPGGETNRTSTPVHRRRHHHRSLHPARCHPSRLKSHPGRRRSSLSGQSGDNWDNGWNQDNGNTGGRALGTYALLPPRKPQNPAQIGRRFSSEAKPVDYAPGFKAQRLVLPRRRRK